MLLLFIDLESGKHLEVCGGRRRQNHIYTSMSNQLEIRLVTRNLFSFLIKFESKYKYVSTVCKFKKFPPRNLFFVGTVEKFEVLEYRKSLRVLLPYILNFKSPSCFTA